jgi:hypothetical protein
MSLRLIELGFPLLNAGAQHGFGRRAQQHLLNGRRDARSKQRVTFGSGEGLTRQEALTVQRVEQVRGPPHPQIGFWECRPAPRLAS